MVSSLYVFQPKFRMHISSPVCHVPPPSTIPIIHDFTTQTTFDEEYRSLSSSLCILLQSPVISSSYAPSILISIQFSSGLNLRSSLNVSDPVSHPYITICKIILPYVLIFIYLDGKREDENIVFGKAAGFFWVHPDPAVCRNAAWFVIVAAKCCNFAS